MPRDFMDAAAREDIASREKDADAITFLRDSRTFPCEVKRDKLLPVQKSGNPMWLKILAVVAIVLFVV
jgi:hypothetical protein